MPSRNPALAPWLTLVFIAACGRGEESDARETASASATGSPIDPGVSYVLQGRARGLCLDSDVASVARPRAHRCESGWTSQGWTLIPVPGKPNVFGLRSDLTRTCLTATPSGGALSMGDCSVQQPQVQWELRRIGPQHVQIANAASLTCLSSASTDRDGALTSATCNADYWSQHFQTLASQQKNLNFSPYLGTDCYIFRDTQENGWYRLPETLSPRCESLERGPGGIPKPRAWLMSGYNEGIGSTGYKPGPLIPPEKTGPFRLWNFAFHPRANGTFQLGMAVDKVSFGDYRDQYTWAGFSDNFDQNAGLRKPLLTDNIYADLQIGLFGHSREYDASTGAEGFKSGMGKSRVMLGALARWGGIDHFLEIVFWKDQEFDGCGATPASTWWADGVSAPNPCDTTGLYDRRSHWATGETLYYDAGKLDQVLGYSIPRLSDGAGMVNYQLPLTKLFKSYAWVNGAPTPDASIGGIYIGLEVYGKASVWAELADYRLYGLGP
jgi:Ricin-type beta-trefoil lectin domain